MWQTTSNTAPQARPVSRGLGAVQRHTGAEGRSSTYHDSRDLKCCGPVMQHARGLTGPWFTLGSDILPPACGKHVGPRWRCRQTVGPLEERWHMKPRCPNMQEHVPVKTGRPSRRGRGWQILGTAVGKTAYSRGHGSLPVALWSASPLAWNIIVGNIFQHIWL